MSSSSGFEAMPGWYWPDNIPKDTTAEEPISSSGPSEAPQPPLTPSSSSDSARTGHGARPRPRHWPPRQCRICLEIVQPTTHVPSEGLPGFFQPAPNVTYEDEGGRLIRPCLCKGSSKYVHDSCLQSWRHADPSYGRRNYWQCPTCGFKYRLARLGAGRMVGSVAAQITMTIVILFLVVFILGFIADPIINMYFDPWSYLIPWSSTNYHYYGEDEPYTWYEHFAKGIASMGVLGFLKVLLASPLTILRIGGGRVRANGRDRYEQVSWFIILIGVGTFLAAIYKGVRVWSRRTLERAGERVIDVQGDGHDEGEDE